jgi:RNA polymerase sigma factor (sigma-70 family)
LDSKKIQEAVKECKASSKNEEAFKLLYDETSQNLYYTILRYIRSDQDAQDILQETFITAFEKVSTFKATGDFGAWIRRIAVNNCLVTIQKTQSFDSLEDAAVLDRVSDKELLSEKEDLEDLVVECLKLLPIGYRTVLNLSIIEEYSHREIAKYLGISEGTSRSQLKRGRELLKKIVQEKRSLILQ